MVRGNGHKTAVTAASEGKMDLSESGDTPNVAEAKWKCVVLF